MDPPRPLIESGIESENVISKSNNCGNDILLDNKKRWLKESANIMKENGNIGSSNTSPSLSIKITLVRFQSINR
jgi:hypothetical protein